MEEASSISKAIEKGWTNAGKPKEFTIKVYEEPEKNFIGMTVRPAKIGIFFSEIKQQAAEVKRSTRQKAPTIEQSSRSFENVVREQPRREPKAVEEKTPRKQEDLGPIWSDDMISSAKAWVAEMMEYMGFGHIDFTITPERFHLRINFAQNLLDDKDKQKHLFAVFSGLLLTMLKRQCKRPLRGYKVVLIQES
jgi:predicted RNA-binding protein Jag